MLDINATIDFDFLISKLFYFISLYNYIIVKKTYICYISFNKIIKVVKMIYNNINKKFVSEDVKKYFKIDKLMFSLVVNLFL